MSLSLLQQGFPTEPIRSYQSQMVLKSEVTTSNHRAFDRPGFLFPSGFSKIFLVPDLSPYVVHDQAILEDLSSKIKLCQSLGKAVLSHDCNVYAISPDPNWVHILYVRISVRSSNVRSICSSLCVLHHDSEPYVPAGLINDLYNVHF